ncbi:hypothetical protein D9M68_697150 [compost metagenome]
MAHGGLGGVDRRQRGIDPQRVGNLGVADDIGITVVAEYEGQEDRVADAVRCVVHAANRFGNAVHAADVRVAEGHAGDQACHQHLLPRRLIVRLLHGRLEVLADQADGMQRQAVADRVRHATGVGFDGMGQGIHAGRGGNRRRQRVGDV